MNEKQLFEMAMGAEVNGNLVHVTEKTPGSKADEKSNMEANFKN